MEKRANNEQPAHKTKEIIKNMDKVYQRIWGVTPDPNGVVPKDYRVEVIKTPKSMSVNLNIQYTGVEVEGSSLSLNEALTPFDKLVHEAIESIYLGQYSKYNQIVEMSPRMIYHVMTANWKSSPSANEIKKINASIDKMQRIFVTVRPTSELQLEKPQIVKISGAMISAVRFEIREEGKSRWRWNVSSLPLLYRVADQWNHIAHIPIEYLDCHKHVRFNEEIGVLKQYLSDRIEKMKRNTYHNNGILVETLYRDVLGTDSPTAKKREHIIGKSGKVMRILEAFKENGYIRDYSFERGVRNSVCKINIRP